MRIAILTAVLAAALLAASAAAASPRHPWPRSYEKQFIKDCEAGASSEYAYCSCGLTYLEKRYTFAAWKRLYAENPTRFGAELGRAATACWSVR